MDLKIMYFSVAGFIIGFAIATLIYSRILNQLFEVCL